ncbi:unnamed protein product [Lampetra planeri]
MCELDTLNDRDARGDICGRVSDASRLACEAQLLGQLQQCFQRQGIQHCLFHAWIRCMAQNQQLDAEGERHLRLPPPPQHKFSARVGLWVKNGGYLSTCLRQSHSIRCRDGLKCHQGVIIQSRRQSSQSLLVGRPD